MSRNTDSTRTSAPRTSSATRADAAGRIAGNQGLFLNAGSGALPLISALQSSLAHGSSNHYNQTPSSGLSFSGKTARALTRNTGSTMTGMSGKTARQTMHPITAAIQNTGAVHKRGAPGAPHGSAGFAGALATNLTHGGTPTTLFATAVAPLEMRLNWTDAGAPADTIYQIERSDTLGGWYRIGSAYSDLKRFTDWGRAPSTSYTYRIRSIDSTRGTSAYFNTVTTTTMAEDGAGEFVGPLAGWKNVKTDYNAIGDGVHDDTAAFNAAFADLPDHVNGAYVIYVPAGTYKISSLISTSRSAAVNFQNGQAMSLIGEHPATTKIQWAGASGGMMMRWDAWYSKIARITFNGLIAGGGGTTAGTALAYGPAFSTFNETSDCIFQDCQIGLQAATAAAGQAENHINRCTFLRCSTYGSVPSDANSLDQWHWHCHFKDCAIGVRNGNGNYHAWHCFFENSSIVDLQTYGFMVMSQVNNVSIGSNQFLDWSVAGGSECGITVSGNRIIHCAVSPAINLGQFGPNLIVDNLIRALPNVTAPQVRTMAQYNGFVSQNCLMAGNLFNIASASIDTDPTLRRIDEEQPTSQPIDPTAPFLPGTPPNLGRTVFEVAAGASAATIQTAINNAAASGTRAVVHLPIGTYNIASTLTVPANATVQILGDAASDVGTILNWTGAAGQPLVSFTGPSKAVLRDCKISAGAGIGIQAPGADQDGGHIYCEQVNCQGDGTTTGFFVNGLDHTDVTAICHQGSDCTVWAKVTGGAIRGAGGIAPNRVCILTGATATSIQQYDVQNGGELIVRSVFHETDNATGTALNLTGRGKLWVDSTRFSYATTSGQPTVLLNGFQGDFVLANAFMLPVNPGSPPKPTCKVSLTGDGALMRALVLCTDFNTDHSTTLSEVYSDTTSPAGANALLNSAVGNPGSLANVGALSDAVLRSLINNMRRAVMRLPGTTPAGVTDLRLQRLFIVGGASGQDVVLSP